MSPLPPVILLGLDTAVGLVAMRELGRRGVPVIGVGYHQRAVGRGSRYLRDFLVRPEGPLAGWLPELVRRYGAGAVLPLRDRDIVDVANIEDRLGAPNLGAGAEAAALVMDKARTLEAARACGVDVPRSWQPRSADEPAPELGWPVVLKWADPLPVVAPLAAAGLPDLKVEYCEDAAALRRALDRYRPIGRWPLVQEYVRGRGLGQTLYMAGGRATLRFQHERVHEWPPAGGVSSLCRAVPLAEHAAQMRLSEALLAALGWDGFAMVEYRFDPAHGRYVLMEVNGHLWGSLALSSACRAEFAWEAYRRRVLGETMEAPAPRAGLSARDLVKETRRIGRLFRGSDDPCFRPTPWRDLGRYLLGFVDPRVRPYVFSWSDPLPAFWSVGAMALRPRRSERRRLAKGFAR
jgi:predicted ATP-grasp superfamily ATP-dependent carboligase